MRHRVSIALSCRARLLAVAALVVGLGVWPHTARADWSEDVLARITPEFLARVWQSGEAVTIGKAVGRPPALPVFNADGENIGFLISTLQSGRYSGYGGTPFDLIAGIMNEGEVMGVAALIDHHEPIIDKGVPLARLTRYLDSLNTVHAWNRYTPELQPNVVQGATITATLMRDGVINSARKVLRTRDAAAYTGPPVLDMEAFESLAWAELREIGGIADLRLTNGQVAAAFARNGYADAELETPLGASDELFIDMFVALGTAPGIGQNIAPREYQRYLRETGGQFLIIAARGAYDLKGTTYRHAAYGKLFDRLRLVQDGHVIHLSGEDYLYRSQFQANPGSPVYNRSGVYGIRDPSFDPLRPFSVQLLVHATADGGRVTIPFVVDYRMPETFILRAEDDSVAAAQQTGVATLPLWMQVWVDQRGDVAVLAVALVVLSLLLWKQDSFTRHRRFYRVVRLAFLAFTFGWLGWYANAQLSVINLLVYFQAPFSDLEWTFYLTEPLIVMVAAYTLVSLFIWGRALFCGWLCPFGALQEFLSRLAGLLRIPQLKLSQRANQRLWWVKYAVWLVLIPVAFLSRDWMVTSVEVEPFKTAISSHFQRDWPFVAYAAGVLAVGLFVERAYCRFVCPLGAGLAVLGRFNAVRFLRRRPECGTPAVATPESKALGGCHLCERTCVYRAIAPDGRIIEHECFYCLDCQAEYHDAYRCPPLAQARKRGERMAQARKRGERTA
ncbi:MAG: 4Fe-4S binding protein [Proteobacteria bacterium]|nr:4Fe-4S binding protein [Pseudomonadota bacterium]